MHPTWMRWKSASPKIRKKRVNYESEECITFYSAFCLQYPDLIEDLERHECGGTRGKVERAILKRQGQKSGFPDYFFYYPSGKFHGLALEMKKSMVYGGSRAVVTPEQLARGMRFRKRGYAFYVCYGAEEALEVIRKYLRCENY